MQLTDAVYCLLLTITVASYTEGADHPNEAAEKRTASRSKREASIFIDNFPAEPMYQHRPNIIYRRVSKQRYRSPKPKYGPPITKYRPTKPRKPIKKYKKTLKPTYGPPVYKKRPTKTKYGVPKPSYKPVYGPPKKAPIHSFYPPDPVGFGEPPQDSIEYEYPVPKTTFGEPPIDSYSAPLNTVINDSYDPEPYISSPSFPEHSNSFDNLNTNFDQDFFKNWQSYQRDHATDNNFAFSKKRPSYVKPETYFDPVEEEFDTQPYLYKYKERHIKREPTHFERKRKPYYLNERIKSKPRKVPKTTPEPEDEVLVGGRYAEPPARYVPKFQPSGPDFAENDDFSSSGGFIDPDVAISATISPYVNYKNSNMAFSPQNLNDAFSIVDK